MILGDFNVFRYAVKWKGKQPPSQSSMDNFNKAISDADLVELDPKGVFFTWEDFQFGENNTMSKITRILVNHEWVDQFSEAWAEIIQTIHSDHHIPNARLNGKERRVEFPFRFVNA